MSRERPSSSNEPLTFNRDIAGLLHQNCAPCHRPGGAGPFNLLNYRDASRRGRQIVEVTQSGFMPPWQPAEDYGEFKDERRLSAEQKQLLKAWVAQGMPEGDPPAPVAPEWPDGWERGRPDLVIQLEHPYVLPASGPDVFRNFILPIPVPGDRFVRPWSCARATLAWSIMQ